MRKLHSHIANPVNDRIEIAVLNNPGAGGACHVYEITSRAADGKPPGSELDPLVIRFQNGPINEAGINGITQEVLLAIVADRLLSFQAGPFACPENADALTHVTEALETLKSRTRERMARGVEGKSVV
ncbi:MAG: hypothetical protein Q7S17_09055 [Xanthobacteraceae bacterium]|nr:hypothetical protein [Xanthobacteraceae bacterium]